MATQEYRTIGYDYISSIREMERLYLHNQQMCLRSNHTDTMACAGSGQSIGLFIDGKLVANIKRDGELSSVPFCVENESGKLTVVSGNHRVQAAKAAGLTIIPVMYIAETDISNDEIRAIQLSHNSISGEDDAEILKQLLDEIQDVAMKEYAHISNEILDAVKDVDYTIEMPNNEIVPVTFMFVDTMKANFDRIIEHLEICTPREIENLVILDKQSLERLNEVTTKVQAKYKIKAQALGICKMVELIDAMLNGDENRNTE